jgi:deoxyribodipyrimidine photo-lyase
MLDDKHIQTALWWIRRDIRLADNPALDAALSRAQRVIPLFILDDTLLARPAPCRQNFLFSALKSLDARLRERGSCLIVRRGKPLDELRRAAAESDAALISAEADISPYARQREDEIVKHLPLVLCQGVSAHPPEAVLKADGQPYTVFTPFSKVWKNLPPVGELIPVPEKIAPIPDLPSEALPNTSPINGFEADEAEALCRLEEFTRSPVFLYNSDRDRMDLPGTSLLSPYLRFGLISARQAVRAARAAILNAANQAEEYSAETWLNELIWREFYAGILYHYPFVLRQSFRENLRCVPWRDSAGDLAAWQNGLTGYPIVDAGMRQLRESGWMHNRARMICASFLCKNLLTNWQAGEDWFMERLLDGDPASNNGGWQWTAGTGTDAAPYFRIFNPILQGKKFDPAGSYVRHWVPELKSVPEAHIHEPWLMPSDLQSRIGVRIGKDYPAPIVEHGFARERTLAAYRSARTENP